LINFTTKHSLGLLAITVLGGLSCATLALLPLLSASAFIFISNFLPLPLFLLGLSVGLRPLFGAGLLASALIFLFEGPLFASEFFFLSFLGSAFLVQRALLTYKDSSQKAVYYPPSFVLRDFTLLAGIVMVLALGLYLYFIQGKNGAAIVENALLLFDPYGHLGDAKNILIKVFSFMPGIFTFSWMSMMLLNMGLAQGFLSRSKLNLRPTPSFRALQIPKSFGIILGLSLLLSVVGVGTLELIGKNAALILAFPFFLSGLDLVHFLLHKTRFSKIGLTLFYSLLLLFIWLALIVVLLGILKPWIEKPTPTN